MWGCVWLIGILLQFGYAFKLENVKELCDKNNMDLVGMGVGEYTTSNEIDASKKINVHLIPHSHDDPGWTKNVDEFFAGTRNEVYFTSVQNVLDAVITELEKDEKRTFMFVEQAFFQRYWREQNAHGKEKIKRLVMETKQLDLSVNGGWCMHDEATPHFTAMMDQTAFGHGFLKQEFNVTPTIGWQIDPFGHSATQASLLSAGVGFDALYFARIHYQDYQIRKRNSDLEFIWRPKSQRGNALQVFTGVIQDHYGAPNGFNFEDKHTEAVNDDPRLTNFNLCDRIKAFVSMVKERSSHTKGQHIFLPMGGDFAFQNAISWFKNMDKIMHYANRNADIHVLYSNLSYYTKLKHAENLQWSIKTDDFFPYADDNASYWGGFFTSRPSLKRYSRVANSFLQSIRTLEAHTQQTSTKLEPLEAAVGLVQHHDALTGTEKQEVAFDYAMRISSGLAKATNRFNELTNASSMPYSICWLTNVSRCDVTEKDNFEVLVYNALPNDRIVHVQLPVSHENLKVSTKSEMPYPIQILPSCPPQQYKKFATHTLNAYLNLPAFGSGSLTFTKAGITETFEAQRIDRKLRAENDLVVLENTFASISISKKNGSITQYRKLLPNGNTAAEYNIGNELLYYRAYQASGQRSGAYVFRPENSTVYSIGNHEATVKYSHTHSDGIDGTTSIQEIQFRISNWATIVYRLNPTDTFLSIEWTIGSIPVHDSIGKEVIMRFSSTLKSDALWYTDSNGYDYVERQRNYRPTWNYSNTEPVAGNYYPVTTGVYLQDKHNNAQLSIATDRAQGTASLRDGEIEIMIHRRLLKDDGRGVNEALNETSHFVNGEHKGAGLVARGTFYLMLNDMENGMRELHKVSHHIFHPSIVAIRSQHAQQKMHPVLGLSTNMPQDVMLHTFQVVSTNVYLVRVSRAYIDTRSSTAVDLQVLFGVKSIRSVEETWLSGLTTRSARQVLSWNHEKAEKSVEMTGSIVRLHNLDVRTFRVHT